MEVKAFENGNLHIKLDSRFISTLNVEHGRLKGWVKSPKDAAEEMNVPLNDAKKCFGCNLRLAADSLPSLLPAPAKSLAS